MDRPIGPPLFLLLLALTAGCSDTVGVGFFNGCDFTIAVQQPSGAARIELAPQQSGRHGTAPAQSSGDRVVIEALAGDELEILLDRSVAATAAEGSGYDIEYRIEGQLCADIFADR